MVGCRVVVPEIEERAGKLGCSHLYLRSSSCAESDQTVGDKRDPPEALYDQSEIKSSQ